jgi:hypothetical protein
VTAVLVQTMHGVLAEEVKGEPTPEQLVAHRSFSSERALSSIWKMAGLFAAAAEDDMSATAARVAAMVPMILRMVFPRMPYATSA